MKLLAIPTLCLCLALAGCGNQGTGPSAELADFADAPNRVEANISGMDCTGCSGQVCNMATGIAGVTGAHADAGTGKVILALEEGADAQAAMTAFQEQVVALAGGEKYTVNQINTVTAAPAPGEPGDVQDPAEPSDGQTQDPAADAEEQAEEQAEQAAQAEEAEETVPVSTRLQANISGMDCSGCSGHVCETAQGIEGVVSAEADHQSGDVVLGLAEGADAQAVSAAFSEQITALAGGTKYTVNTIAQANEAE